MTAPRLRDHLVPGPFVPLTEDETDWCISKLGESVPSAQLPTVAAINWLLINSGLAATAAETIFETVLHEWDRLAPQRVSDLSSLCQDNLTDLTIRGCSRRLAHAPDLMDRLADRYRTDETPPSVEATTQLAAIGHTFLRSVLDVEMLQVLHRYVDALLELPLESADAQLVGPLLASPSESTLADIARAGSLADSIDAVCRRWVPLCTDLSASGPLAWKFRINDRAGESWRSVELLHLATTPPDGLTADDLARVLVAAASVEDSEIRSVVLQLIDRVADANSIAVLQLARLLNDDELGRRWLTRQETATANKRIEESRFHYTMGRGKESLAAAAPPIARYAALVQESLDGTIDIQFPTWANATPTRSNAFRVAHEAQLLADHETFIDAARTRGHGAANETVAASAIRRQVIAYSNGSQLAIHLPMAAIERSRIRGGSVSYCNQDGHLDDYVSDPARRVAAALREAMRVGSSDVIFHWARTKNEWVVDLEHQVLEFRGINFFPLVFNSLGIRFRRYSQDFQNPIVRQSVEDLMRQIGFTFDAVVECGRAVAGQPDQYAFVVVAVQHGASAAIRKAVDAVNLPNVRLVHACNGMEIFGDRPVMSDDGSNRVSQFHCVADLTRQPNVPLALRPSPREFTLESASSTSVISEPARSFIERTRAKMEAAEAAASRARSDRWTVLLLGKVLPDLSIPEDRGLVHRDIEDWLTHSISIAADHPEIDVHIKLHPDENIESISYFVTERFPDLVGALPPNVVVLPYDTDLVEVAAGADLTVLWSGTSVLELSLTGLPFLCASATAQYEYPLVHHRLRDRKHYEQVFTGSTRLRSLVPNRERAERLIDAITSPPVREAATAFERPLTNGRLRHPVVHLDEALDEMAGPGADRMSRTILGFDEPRGRPPSPTGSFDRLLQLWRHRRLRRQRS